MKKQKHKKISDSQFAHGARVISVESGGYGKIGPSVKIDVSVGVTIAVKYSCQFRLEKTERSGEK